MPRLPRAGDEDDALGGLGFLEQGYKGICSERETENVRVERLDPSRPPVPPVPPVPIAALLINTSRRPCFVRPDSFGSCGDWLVGLDVQDERFHS